MTKDIFISYASENAKIANQICTYLEKQGHSCWIAPRDILPGTEYGEAIIRGLEHSRLFVLIYSEESNRSQHVLREVERAVNKRIPIIAYKISSTPLTKSLEYFLMTNQWLDATEQPNNKFAELNKSIVDLLILTEPSELAADETLSVGKKMPGFLAQNKFAILLALIAAGIIAIAVTLNGVRHSINDHKTAMPEKNLPTGVTPFQSTITQTPGATLQPSPTEMTTANPTNVATDTAAGTNNSAGSTTATNLSAATKATVSVANLKEGQYLYFGRYRTPGYLAEDGSTDIQWRILNVNRATGQVLLLSERILDIKPYDVAESGKFDKDNAGNSYDRTKLATYSPEEMIQYRGNSDWEYSNIRTWLNSDTERVTYTGQAPISKGVDEACNGYYSQAGFLAGFTPREKALITVRAIKTPVNALKQGANLTGSRLFEFNENILKTGYNFADVLSKTTHDKVFLLSLAEVKTYLYDRKFSIFAQPTQAAIRSDRSSWVRAYLHDGRKNYIWALRTPDSMNSYKVCLIGVDDNGRNEIISRYAGGAGLGIRPAMAIKLGGVKLTGNGSEAEPYRLIE